MWRALTLASELGYMIALPLVVFALVGRVIDQRLGTSPFALIAGLILALVATTFWIVKKINELKNNL